MIGQIILLVIIGISCFGLLLVGVQNIRKKEYTKGTIHFVMVILFIICILYIGSIYKYKIIVKDINGTVLKEYYNVKEVEVDYTFGNSITFYDIWKMHWMIENHPQKVEQDGNKFIVTIGK